ncbi:MAG TPA: 4'-phosphopantetheinyl transferase superfamily protein [Pseudorhodoplanes sp.]|jgi:4'-phosphopantetheinyl transferase EntD|nr:4'-phosphopantetheinyl transferase superfamily protein [Pseudorhodoplanes sp.]
MSEDPVLAEALRTIAAPGLLVGHRLISPGDEGALLPPEAASITSKVPATRRASGAARIVARRLLAELGEGTPAIPKGASGAPTWPAGIAGSFAHDDRTAIAAIGRVRDVGSIGIDVEPALPLPADMFALIVSPRERAGLAGDMLRARLLFAAKEAVYKAVHPLDGQFLEYSDIEIDIAAGTALVKNARPVRLKFCTSTRLVALALA